MVCLCSTSYHPLDLQQGWYLGTLAWSPLCSKRRVEPVGAPSCRRTGDHLLAWAGRQAGLEIPGRMTARGGRDGADHLPASPAAVPSGCPSEYRRSHRLRSPARHLGPSPQRSRPLGASPGPHWWLSRPSGHRGSAIWLPAPGTTRGIRPHTPKWPPAGHEPGGLSLYPQGHR